MKRNAFTLVELLIVVAIIAVLAAFLWPSIPHRNPGSARRSSCQSNLKQIGLGYLQYVQDYDEKFPITSTEPGWFGAIQPYLKSEAIFRCPSEEVRGDDNLTDYWFNRRLAGVAQKNLGSATLTLLSVEGEPSDDPNVSLQLMPPRWISKENSPARRHFDTANYLFADGHVKSLKPKMVTADAPDKNAPTFLIR